MLKGSILQQIEATHQDDSLSKRPLSLGVYYKNTLVALCHALEDSILHSQSAPLVIAAFQQGKWYLEEADHYKALAERSRHVVIMAVPDSGFADHATSQRPDVSLVPLQPDDPVAQEWHLMILSPTYTAMVLCQELSEADYGPRGYPQEDRQRKFYGLWTFEAGLVQEAMETAIAHIGRYNPQLQAQLQTHLQQIRAEFTQTDTNELHNVVSRVVDYLQVSEQGLSVSHASLNDNLVSNELQAFLRVAQLIDLLDTKNPQAASEVTALAEMMGQLLDLPAWQIKRLRLASLLHRIGAPMSGAGDVLTAAQPTYTPEEAPYSSLSCSLVPGTQTLRIMPRLRAIAQIINHQSEWWNGSGYPGGLAGDYIPLESRILGLVADFQQRIPSLDMPTTDEATLSNWQNQLEQALLDIQSQGGDRWDPKLVEALSLIVRGLQQGIQLPVKSPKMTNGLWLLESETTSDLDPFASLQSRSAYTVEEARGY